MPLDNYGVLVGTLTGHHRDTPDDQGRWFHVNLDVNAPPGRYRCAIDVDGANAGSDRPGGGLPPTGEQPHLGCRGLHPPSRVSAGIGLCLRSRARAGQDGVTLVYRPDGQYNAFRSKFTSQADETDDHGHPLQ